MAIWLGKFWLLLASIHSLSGYVTSLPLCEGVFSNGSGSGSLSTQSKCVPLTADTVYPDCIQYFPEGKCHGYAYNYSTDDLMFTLSVLQASLDGSSSTTPYCRLIVSAYICNLIYAGCNPITETPQGICEEECYAYTEEGVCRYLFDDLVAIAQNFEQFPFKTIVCNDTLGNLREEFGEDFVYNSSDCISLAGVAPLEPPTSPLPTETPITTRMPRSRSDDDLSSSDVVAIAVVVPIAVFMLLSIAVIVLMAFLYWRQGRKKITLQTEVRSREDPIVLTTSIQNDYQRVQAPQGMEMMEKPSHSSEAARLLARLPAEMVISCADINLQKCIGEGEFGIVYRANLKSAEQGRGTKVVAVKTLKGFFSATDVQDIVKEIQKMQVFDHPNVMSLIGVSVDSGSAPSIIMPYMERGSLLNYLRKEKGRLIVKDEDSDRVEIVHTQLLKICLQISKGMEYLAQQKFIHRDLAARNCMIDMEGVIKISDFGLAEDVYMTNYFRMDKNNPNGGQAKIPFKWLPLESLQEGVFNEKTDVWSFGVTCWEVFTSGKIPYPAVGPTDLLKLLEMGKRLEKPTNFACSDDSYSVLLNCWDTDPAQRPTFSELVATLSTLLEASAGYLTLEMTGETGIDVSS